MKCIFCDIVAGKISAYKVWENTNFLVFLDINPINPGHILVIPKIHCGDVYDLPDDLYAELFKLIKKIAPAFKKAMQASRTGLIVEGFGVDHTHVHLVPINFGNELNPDRAKPATAEDLGRIQALLVEEFKKIR